MIEITARRMDGGTDHEHIAAVRWTNTADGTTGENTIATMVKWIDSGGKVCVRLEEGIAVVAIIRSDPPHLRTHSDNKWTDHLLDLPEY